MPAVQKDYVPTETTINYLKNKNYSKQHIWDIVQKFRINFDGREFQNIEEKFKKVMCQEFATDAPQKPIEDHTLDLSHRSKDSIEKAAEVKQTAGIMSKAEAIAWYDQQRGNTGEGSQTVYNFKSWIKQT